MFYNIKKSHLMSLFYVFHYKNIQTYQSQSISRKSPTFISASQKALLNANKQLNFETWDR